MMEATVTMSLAAYKELERDLLEAEQKVNRAEHKRQIVEVVKTSPTAPIPMPVMP